MFAHRKPGLFLFVSVDDIKRAGKKQNTGPMWKKSMKNVGIDEPKSFLDHVYLGCTQRQCKPIESFWEHYKKMFESLISAGAMDDCDLEDSKKLNLRRCFFVSRTFVPAI